MENPIRRGEKKPIKAICISAKEKEEEEHLAAMIKDISPNTKIVHFRDALEQKDVSLFDDCDFIFPYGGDGTVAWLVKTFFTTFGSLKKFKPLVPVIKRSSVGFLKQLDGDNEHKFKEGFQKLLDGHFLIQNRTILHTKIKQQEFLAVNEIMLLSAPVLGKFSVFMHEEVPGNSSPKIDYAPVTTTMADGVLVSTSIGSTSWTLSHKGQINLDEGSLQLIFVGGIHSSANFTLPRKPLRLQVELKNSSITPETVEYYNEARKEAGLREDPDSEKALHILFSQPRVVVDGKLLAFGVSSLEIDSSMSIPFCILEQHTPVDKARRISSNRDQYYTNSQSNL